MILLFSMIAIIPFAFSQEENIGIVAPFVFNQEEDPTLILDKESYVLGDKVLADGSNYPTDVSLSYLIVVDNSALVATIEDHDEDGNITFTFTLDSRYTEGSYLLYVVEDLGGHYAAYTATEFWVGDIPEPEPIDPLTIQTDKSEYYIDQLISVNGTMTDVDWLEDTTILYDVTRYTEIIQTGDGGILYDDGTFDFIVDTNGWDEGGTEVNVTIQGYNSTASFYYYNEIDMTSEGLYEMIIGQYDMIEDIEDELILQNETLVLQGVHLELQNKTLISQGEDLVLQNGTLVLHGETLTLQSEELVLQSNELTLQNATLISHDEKLDLLKLSLTDIAEIVREILGV